MDKKCIFYLFIINNRCIFMKSLLMDTQAEKKITPNEAIVRILNAAQSGRIDHVYKVAELFLDSIPTSSKYYWPIKNILRNKPITMVSLESMPSNLKSLLIVQEHIGDSVFLNEDVASLIDELTTEWNHIDSYRYHNLKVRNKVLFYGETGNGKTTVARHIAKLANLPFIEVKSDVVIDSHLGTTGGNIHKILNEIKQPCVLFWDEVDSIGKRRGGTSDSSAQHENDRMTNSILTNLDKVWDEVVFIAATNRRDVLDSAFLRRFDVQLEIKAPTDIEKERFAIQQFDYYKIPDSLMPDNFTNFKNYSEIKQHILAVARRYVLENIIKNEENKASAA